MRLLIALCGLLCAGCAGPHTTGALWAQQNLERELNQFRVTDVQRAALVRGIQLGVADEALAAERTRVNQLVQSCAPDQAPTESPPLSTGNVVRDGIRIQIGNDPDRATALTQLGLADWYARRGECDRARQALQAPPAPALDTPEVLRRLGSTTVVRDPTRPATPRADDPVLTAISLYATHYVDAITAAAPLPQYLAAVYGGSLSPPSAAELAGRRPADLVDELAPSLPGWEPDALYAALSTR